MVKISTPQRFMGLSLVLAAVLGGTVACSGQTSGANAGGATSTCPATIDAKKLEPAGFVGMSPRNKPPAGPEAAVLTPEEEAKAKASKFKVGIAMQTMDIDYSTILVRAMKRTFSEYGVDVLSVTDGGWNVTKQQTDIQNLIQMKPNGILSVPTDSVGMASTYKTVSKAGIKLVTLDDTPAGLEYPTEVAASSGMDQKGMGQIAMAVLAECIPQGGTVGMANIDIVLWAANQRTDGAVEWLKKERPDIKIKSVGFTNPNDVTQKAADFLTANPDVQGLWTPWDGPGLQALSALRSAGSNIPITTQDLGNEFATNVAQGTQLIGGGAQELDAQGRTHALTMIKAMLGSELPEYIAHPAVVVTKSNLLEAYERVWGEKPPADLEKACGDNEGCS